MKTFQAQCRKKDNEILDVVLHTCHLLPNKKYAFGAEGLVVIILPTRIVLHLAVCRIVSVFDLLFAVWYLLGPTLKPA